jgi:alkanesulfonate monooxygenase SsuD/methylene tetrahydromethanopterin reductase-like flavin-dependent oxidoreductase (luciferase family)
MVGGSGEKKTLRLVAQYGDACNLYAFDNTAEVRRKLEVLRRHCEEVGRAYDEIERTAIGAFDFGPGGITSAEAVKRCRNFADAGIQHLIVSLPRVHEMTPIEVMRKEVIPAAAGF